MALPPGVLVNLSGVGQLCTLSELDANACPTASQIGSGTAPVYSYPALRGGTGVSFDWRADEPIVRARRVVVSGGLTPENVGACVRALRPYAVDVRSGIETDGRKDPAKMAEFISEVTVANGDVAFIAE